LEKKKKLENTPFICPVATIGLKERKPVFAVRYLSIDFYRGATIAFMLIVNTPGTWAHVFAPLLHADWNGCTPTDLVFPSFLFIIGVSMWFSFEKYGRTANRAVLVKVLKRTAILFGLGLLLAWFPFWGKNLSDLRILGVLQRLALCYGIAAILALYLSEKWLTAAALLLLFGYWAAMVLGALPDTDPLALETNLVRRVDLALFGPEHLWNGKGIPFDPEGLLSTLPAVANVLFGWWSGQIMQSSSADKMRAVTRLAFWGVLLTAAGYAWHQVFPMNKSLWTSSFVLFTSGISMVLLACCVWAIDVRGWRNGVRFFLVFGANPLFAYILSGLLVKTLFSIKWTVGEETWNGYRWLYQTVFMPIEPYKTGSFLFALAFLMVCWAVCWALYRRKVYIKI
jgi:predicted acyltransferase